jgi:osmoprotectant transport system ATP-binding protein
VLSKGGVLEQHDTPAEILGRPATPFVADFVGTDRGVRRLGVTAISPEDLFHPPVVPPDASMLDARAMAAGADSRWALVVDDDRLLGWIDLDPSLGGAVADHLVAFEVQVPVGTSLRAALGEMLQHDVRWVPVVEGPRYLGILTPNALHAAMRRSVGGQPTAPGRTRTGSESAGDTGG